MAKKDHTPRQNQGAPDRQKAIDPSWRKPIGQTAGTVILNREHFLSGGAFDRAALWEAKEAYPGKDLAFHDASTSKLYVERGLYADPQNRTGISKLGWGNISDLHKGNQSLKRSSPVLYDMPALKPTVNKFAEEASRARDDILKAKNVVKVDTTEEIRQKREAREAIAEKRRLAAERDRFMRSSATSKLEILAKKAEKQQRDDLTKKVKNQFKKESLVAKQPKEKPVKVVVPKTKPQSAPRTYPKRGEKWDGTQKLGRRQYVSSSGTVYNTSAKRIAEMKRVQAKRKSKQLREEKLRQKKVIYRQKAHLKALERQRENHRLRAIDRRKLVAGQRREFKAAQFAKTVQRAQKVQANKKYGKVPLHFVTRDSKLAANVKSAFKTFPRGARYPAMKHSSAAPLKPPVSLGGVLGRQTLMPSGKTDRWRGTSAFATAKTLSMDDFGGNSRGLFFRIDADQVIANLVQRFPAALREAAIATSDRIGRKLLDIVEPYVPKDTGLLYSTAATSVAQTAGGMMSMGGDEEEGGGIEAYPAGEMYGVSISYNAPYAEIVYFDKSKAHGEDYNRKHGTSEKDPREIDHWIEKAFEKNTGAVKSLLGEYAVAITRALDSFNVKPVSFKTRSGRAVEFFSVKG